MNTAVRILCILFKYHHITDLLMNRHWFLVRQRILFKVIVQIIRHIFIYFIMLEIRGLIIND